MTVPFSQCSRPSAITEAEHYMTIYLFSVTAFVYHSSYKHSHLQACKAWQTLGASPSFGFRSLQASTAIQSYSTRFSYPQGSIMLTFIFPVSSGQS